MKFWNLRIHPVDENDYPLKMIADILKEHSLIGMSRFLRSNDPNVELFKNEMQKDDIVCVSAKAIPLLLVKVTGDYRSIIPHSPLSFFNLNKLREVEVLSDNPQKYAERFLKQNRNKKLIPSSSDLLTEETNEGRFVHFWYHEFLKEAKVESLKNNLLATHNLILTGAPGTGKTYLARQIAYAITNDNENEHPHVESCQFHPSYDYTDFVEGIRPTRPNECGTIGFERQDGVFMSFCRKAIKESFINARDNFEEAWQKLIDYLNEESISVPTLNRRSGFELELNESGTGLVSHMYRSKADKECGMPVSNRSKYFNHDQLYRVYRGLSGVPNGGHDNYRRAIIKMMKLRFQLNDYDAGSQTDMQHNPQKYVFIIDEINRGDVAKIFGELFYAIDADYRGKKGRILTQYARLNEDDEIFKDGFYVPENIYIIGTMNDIDRNVDSMDFAIRRRFAWVEISPEETIDMLDNVIPQYAESAKKVMAAINAKIANTDGLDSAYQLGAAYFLKLKDYNGDFDLLWRYNIAPVLKGYLCGMQNIEETMHSFREKWMENLPARKKKEFFIEDSSHLGNEIDDPDMTWR